MAEKLDFSMAYNGQDRAVKARVFKTDEGAVYAVIDGALFNGWEVSAERLDVVIELLQDVRESARRVANE